MTASTDTNHKSNDAENQTEKIPYPKSVFFIISNEFCERFSYFGMRTILSLYLTDILLFEENTSKIIFHIFAFLVNFFPTFGAIISDSWLGKYKTILYLSMVYSIGNILLALSATPPLNLPPITFALVGLFIIAVGTGGIKPCVSAFGGDQFVLPQQEAQLATFFNMFYFSINAGGLISATLTPILREDVHCYDMDSCYSLAFAVPGILMIVSIVIFVLGRPLYKVSKPHGNMIITVSKCMVHAVRTKSNSTEKKSHWLDHAEATYGKELVEDIKSTLRVLYLYIPLPIYWALYDQQATGWTFQARKMDGDLGAVTILPDQMQVINPYMILAFIPIFQYVIYPILNKINILKTPLKRMVAGGMLVALSFFISASISLALEAQYPKLPEAGNAQIRIYNNEQCELYIKGDLGEVKIPPMNFYEKLDVNVNNNLILNNEYSCGNTTNLSFKIELVEEKAFGIYFSKNIPIKFEDDVTKDSKARSKVRILHYSGEPYTLEEVEGTIVLNGNDSIMQTTSIGSYHLKIGDKKYGPYDFRLGGVYAILIDANKNDKLIEVTPPNSISMMWLLPQYILITMGEIMFSVTGLQFAYSQAPTSMKSLLQACWVLTTAVGNLIVVIIEAIDPFEEQSSNFFLYASIMLVDMIIFAVMARSYVYVQKKKSDSEETSTETS